MGIIDGFQKTKDLNNLKSDPVLLLLTIPLLKQITNWFKELSDLGISIPTCMELFKVLTGPILITAIGEDPETMKKNYDGFINPSVIEPFIVMRIYKMMNDGNQEFRNQDERVSVIKALIEGIKPKNKIFTKTQIIKQNPNILKAKLNEIKDILFGFERTGSNKSYSHKITEIKTIENAFYELGLTVTRETIEYFKTNGW